MIHTKLFMSTIKRKSWAPRYEVGNNYSIIVDSIMRNINERHKKI